MFQEKNLPELIRLFFKASGLIREKIRQSGSWPKVSLVNIKTLQYIAERGEPTMKDVADYLAISPPSASAIVENYVKDGQLERVLDKSDRRVVRLKLTRKGKTLLSNHMANIVKVVEGILAMLDPKQIEELKIIMKKLIVQFE